MLLTLSKALLASAVIASAMTVASVEVSAQQAIKSGGVLSGELRAMRSRDPKGKRINTFQLVTEPRKLPGPNGLCNLETGPETFQIVTSNDAEASRLKSFIGKQVSIKADEMACAELAGQMSDAIVSKWSLVTSH
ncbi:hypothetical protein [Bradyrhizobium prioriisuperbiae]|uniref:hypothetical protein n=1 Tax=Bradyrhizobium prioriisuperbiae TaxID=2854389 RepID=UPI0028EAF9E1|nr:hypothetical protein [Bradyrhizobium prioritasuperba]